MRFSLIPREESFFDLFEKASNNLYEAASLLADTMEHFDKVGENAMRMERIEHGGDQIVHEISARLNHTFITPLDREDIHHLASAIDDILDLIEQTTERFVLFKIKEVTPFAKELAQVIQRQVEEIHTIMPQLRDPSNKDILNHCIEINRLENAGDRVLRNALEDLFSNSADPIHVIKWRELYGSLEEATDKCEDVAVVIESILVKNG
jgi:predicted phosphate transport protein (TIGR00153 family)